MPAVAWSLSNQADLIAGAVVGAGRRATGGRARSEFGSVPDLLYAELKAYF